MDAISPRQLVLVALAPDEDGSGLAPRRSISAVTNDASGGATRLSTQVEIAAAIDDLVEAGLVRRESTEGEVSLRLTAEGCETADEARRTIGNVRIELADGEQRSEHSIQAVADRLDATIVEVVTKCSADGVYYLESTPRDEFIGRTKERETIQRLARTARSKGTGATCFLTGAGGVGKTRLADEVLDQPPEGVDVVRTRCRSSAGEPYQPIRDLLDRIGADDPLDAAGIDVEDPETYRSQQSALFYDFTEQFVPESGARVLFFDDIDHADPATWSYLSYLADRIDDLPLVVLAAHRPGTLPEGEAVSDVSTTTQLTLTGLDRDETRRLVEQLVGRRGAPDAFVEAIHERTDGIPLFVETAIETLLDSGALDAQFEWYPEEAAAIDLPDEVNRTVVRQVGLLDRTARDVLEWTAIAGTSVPASELETLVDAPDTRVAAVIDTLVQTGTVVRDGDRIDFRSNVIRETVLDELDDEIRRSRHETVAQRLERAHGDGCVDRLTTDASAQPDGLAARIGHHYEAAADPEAAIGWYENAARNATSVYAHETAIEQYHCVLELAREIDQATTILDAGQRLAEIYLTIGEYDEADRFSRFVRERTDEGDQARRRANARLAAAIASGRGNYEEAVDAAEAGLELTEEPDREHCRLLAAKADAERNQSQYDAVVETSEELRTLAEAIGATGLQAEATQQLGVIALERSEYDRARSLHEDALACCQAAGDRHREADVRMGLGIIGKRTGEYDRAREHWTAALDAYEAVGDRHQIAKAYNNLGLVAKDDDQYDQAREYYQDALDAVERIGDRDTAALVRVNLGNVCKLRSAFDEAEGNLTAAIEAFDDVGHSHHAAVARLNLGALLLTRGEYDRGETTLSAGLDAVQSIEDTHRVGQFRAGFGRLALKRGEFEQAEESYSAALDVGRTIENDRLIGITRLGRARLQYRQGEADAAATECEQALELLRATGEQVDVAKGLRTRAEIETARGNEDHAESLLDTALSTYEAIGDDHGIAFVNRIQGDIARARGDDDGAERAYQRALEIFKALRSTHETARTHKALGELALETDRRTVAREHLKTAFETFGSLGTTREAAAAVEGVLALFEEQEGAQPDEELLDAAAAVVEDAETVSPPVESWLDGRS